MTILESRYKNIYEAALVLLAVSLPFRMPATYLLFLFFSFNLFFYRQLNYSLKHWIYIVLIASPFLLDLLFLWNNDSLAETVKQGEKRLSLLLLPFFILGQRITVDLFRILRYYAIITTGVLLFFLLRFALVYPDLFQKYLQGMDLWEMGYRFADSMGIHAPALNMHMAFVVVINFYFLLFSVFEEQGFRRKILKGLLFLISVIVLLYINTRLAIAFAGMGILLVTFSRLYNDFSLRKSLISAGVLLMLCLGVFAVFAKTYPHILDKFGTITFRHMDKVGELDQITNPEAEIYNSLVTRVSIWKSTLELARENLPFGTGAASAKEELFAYYESTDQQFLAKYEFPVHNQYLDFLLRFGFIGTFVVFFYIGLIGYLGIKERNVLIFFFFLLFAGSNLVDDFLIRFDGIVFSGLWLSIFAKNHIDRSSLYRLSN